MTKDYTVSQKTALVLLFNNSVKHWPILIIFGTQHQKKIDVSDCSFVHLTLILLLHYPVKSRTRSSAVYNNEFILGSTCAGSENHCESTKSLKIVTCLTLTVSTLRSCCQTYIQCAHAHCLNSFRSPIFANVRKQAVKSSARLIFCRNSLRNLREL